MEHACFPQCAGASGGLHPVHPSSPPVPVPVGANLEGPPVIHPDSFSLIPDMPAGGKPEKPKVKAGVLDSD